MAKKDRLKNLLGNIGESLNEPQPQQENSVAKEVVEELGITPEMEEQLNLIRRSKVGRPQGRKNGNPKPREDRATFIVDRDVVRKLKYIALMDMKLYKNVINEALSGYIAQWEQNNGAINLPTNND
ncbi:MAG: hypothetical protein IKT78_01455 [Ruminiclostridium sp.]|nr:hypothetical protein [Ruminiclostridium sp.]